MAFDDHNFIDQHPLDAAEERAARERRLYVERAERLQQRCDQQDDTGWLPPTRGPLAHKEDV